MLNLKKGVTMKEMSDKVLADKSLTVFLAIVIVGLVVGWVG